MFARSVRRIKEQRWSAEDLRAFVETLQKPKSTTPDVLSAVDQPAVPLASPEQQEDKEENPADEPRMSSSKGEKCTQAQEAVPAKRRMTKMTPTGKRTANFEDTPVKRKVTGKTDTQSDNTFAVDEERRCVLGEYCDRPDARRKREPARIQHSE